jgi:hypothetical protein
MENRNVYKKFQMAARRAKVRERKIKGYLVEAQKSLASISNLLQGLNKKVDKNNERKSI